jgi:hypothetical protein
MSGLTALAKAEIKWCLSACPGKNDSNRWKLQTIQTLLAGCRGADSLEEIDAARLPRPARYIHAGMIRQLRVVCTEPSGTRAAGYVEFDHFGAKVMGVGSEFSLTAIGQRWLRELVWDYLTARLRSVNPPRGGSFYHGVRTAFTEFSVFLDRRDRSARD